MQKIKPAKITKIHYRLVEIIINCKKVLNRQFTRNSEYFCQIRIQHIQLHKKTCTGVLFFYAEICCTLLLNINQYCTRIYSIYCNDNNLLF